MERSLGLPTLVLMENAAINAAGAIFDLLRESFVVDQDSARVAILCGGGSNGGDGYGVARHLKSWGLSPRVYSTHDPDRLSGDAGVNARVWKKMRGQVTRIDDPVGLSESVREWAGCQLIVDALLGTGYGHKSGPVREPTAAVIERVNALRQPEGAVPGDEGSVGHVGLRVVALDVPSGLDADTGEPGPAGEWANGFRPVVAADLTVTFVAEKAGFARARRWVGRSVVAEIGVPGSVIARALALDV